MHYESRYCKKHYIAVSSAEAERSFSTMNRIKTKLRTLINDERTSDLILLSHEAGLTKSLDLESIITKFAQKKPRKVPLTY